MIVECVCCGLPIADDEIAKYRYDQYFDEYEYAHLNCDFDTEEDVYG